MKYVILTLGLALVASCFSSNSTECSGGVVCPEGSFCTADGLGCRTTRCGDGVMDSSDGETCDDGNLDDHDDCTNACQTATCDDAAETATCDADCSAPMCGDGEVNPAANEQCDNGTASDSATCDRDCTNVVCGDTLVNMMAGEQCDDGGTDPGDTCSPTCKVEMCGNNTTDPGEACDDGNSDPNDTCRNDCLSNNTCGNGVLDDQLPKNPMTDPGLCLDSTTQSTGCAEVCDDDNQVSGDGCSANCLSEEICGNGIVDV